MLHVRPYEDHGAMAVLSRLDPHDWHEAQLVIGGDSFGHLRLFAAWAAIQPLCVQSHVVTWSYDPVALVALARTGTAGVAQASFLARDHGTFRWALSQAGWLIRQKLDRVCSKHDLTRIEARAWAGHPTAARFLCALGFQHEADLRGFGPGGRETFRLFAFTPH